MVEPVTSAVTGVVIGIPWAVHLWNIHGPKRVRNVACLGMWDTGKSTWEECVRPIEGEPGDAVIHNDRKETSNPGDAYETYVPGAKRKFHSKDFPYTIEGIPHILDEINPHWIQIFTDVNKWKDVENQKIIEKVVDWLRDEEYASAHDAQYKVRWSWIKQRYVRKRKRGTGKTGCKKVTIYLNKIDEWRDLSNFDFGKRVQKIALKYLRKTEDNPLIRLRGYVSYEFVALSLWEGECYKYPRVWRKPTEYSDYLIEVSKKI